MAHGRFIWNELMTGDVEAAKDFYAALVGWTYEARTMPQGGTYWVAMRDGMPAAGLMAMHGMLPPGVPPHWFEYLHVDDVDARLAIVTAEGGAIARGPFDIAGVGRIAIVHDSAGAALGLMTPAD